MRIVRRQFGMTLVELLVVLMVALILISATARLGQHVKTRSEVQLTHSLLAIIDTALQLYYDDYEAFPFLSIDLNGNGRPDDYLWEHLKFDIEQLSNVQEVSVNAVDLSETGGDGAALSFASSAGLYYFLNRNPNSRSIVSALSSSLITTMHPQDRQPLVMTITRTALPPETADADMVRFVDSWGTSLWYRYEPGYTFPRVISAGPDRIFGTNDDIEHK